MFTALSCASCAADGRDVPDGSSVQFTQQLKDDLQGLEAAHPGLDAKIASGGGRMNVTMDRYEVGGRWQPASRCLYGDPQNCKHAWML